MRNPKHGYCFFKAKVIDEQGFIVPRGEKGELCIRGYGVMLGYWNDPEATKRVICSDRWYRTGWVHSQSSSASSSPINGIRLLADIGLLTAFGP